MSYFYMICPVGTDPDFVSKRSVLESVGSRFGLPPFFPFERRGDFSVAAALRDMRGADLVVADLSYERPSCYFEMGLAEAVGKRVFLLAKEGTRIHQVGHPQSISFYSELPDYAAAVSKILGQRISLQSAS
jgi:nucleoside 2-deoxyribosyltransferase